MSIILLVILFAASGALIAAIVQRRRDRHQIDHLCAQLQSARTTLAQAVRDATIEPPLEPPH
jgi:hypothetical protein